MHLIVLASSMDYIQRCTERCTEPFWQRSKPQMCAAPIGGGSVGATARVRVAFLGNSIIYFNDVPRLIEAISGGAIEQDSCLRGGVSFGQLMERGNGMRKKFPGDAGAPSVAALLSSSWDFVVMNDFTQAPAREATRQEGIEVLRTQLAPLIARSGATPVLLQTWAYREVVKGSGDLGDTSEFTRRLAEGYRAYAAELAAALPAAQLPRIAPVGAAFAAVHAARPELWRALFHTDGFHPSPLGSFLEACTIHTTIFGSAPAAADSVPAEPAQLWARARLMQPVDHAPLPLPTVEELEYLREVARSACAAEARRAAQSRL